MKTKFILTVCLPVLFFTGLSCNSPTEPKDNPGSDTTSHNFVWDIDTIGYQNISLYDGVIINENDIWVVGDIYPDSASYWDVTHYGAAHWDGKKWTAKKIPVKTTADYIGLLPPQGIIKIKENEFWLVAGSVHVFDGEKVTKSYWIHNVFGIPNPIFEEGQNPTDLFQSPDGTIYCYGYQGALGYFNGSSWVKIPTNTTLDIKDMHGDYNPNTKEYELLALASTDDSHLDGSRILKINKTSVSEVPVSGMSQYAKDNIWFTQGSTYWITGGGAYFKNSLSDNIWSLKKDYPSSNYSSIDVNGWNQNDVMLTLSDAHLLHFNGSTWVDFKYQLNLFGISLNQIIIKDDLILVLGGENNSHPKGIILRGKRIR